MVRAMKNVSSLTIALAIAWQASALRAQEAGDESPRPADYVVEIPAEDEAAFDSYGPQPLATADDHEGHDHAHHDHDGHDHAAKDERPADDREAADDGVDTEIIKERFPNGAIRIEREVTQDAQGNYVNHGPWKMWDERGNVVAQGQYAYGNRMGTWVRWYRSVSEANLLSKMPYQQYPGPFVSQATFKDDQLDGVWIIYDAKMHKISQWSFMAGKRHGPSTWWFANGKKMREAQFKDGDMDGIYLEWSPDGAMKLKENFESGRKIAVKTSHHNGGAKKSEGMYLFARDIEHSPDDWWNCKLVTTTKTGKDEKHGAWTSWYANGQKQLEGNYEHDVQVGLFTWWHANGQRALEGRFDSGKQDGSWTWWHANGQKSIHGEYAKGNPTGRWTWWKEDGRVVQSADLSHSDGIVIDTPRPLDQEPPAPRVSKPAARTPVRR